ncbi:MAG: class I SAM-dependent methyltransferase [Nitriliruptor sp.]|nr:MAG: class I SAM-dependent methyltransferase [Nitriliruptor sp.]
MPDAIFADPRLSGIYDAVEGDRSDLDVYVGILDELGAQAILDVGCGTGELACRLARDGKDVVGIDPAVASLDVARRKPGAERVRWVEGDATALPAVHADVVMMTGNVAQVFLDDESLAAAFAGARRVLGSEGHLVFEVRIPAQRAWEQWHRDATERTVQIEGIGTVATWIEVTSVVWPFVSFRRTYVFEDDHAVLTSDSTLRFRDRPELENLLLDAGFVVRDVRDAPDRPGLEWIFLAQPAPEMQPRSPR